MTLLAAPTSPHVVLPLPSIPCTLPQAIARMEGFYEQGLIPNRPQRNNNPGDLELRHWMLAYGADKGDPRFAIFPTPQQGFAALRHLLTLSLYRGKSISQAISIFAPGSENNVKIYTLNCCAWTEKTPETIIDELLG